MTVASPLWLLALLLIPLFAWIGARVVRFDRERMENMVTASMFERIGRRFPPSAQTMRSVCFVVGAALLVAAMRSVAAARIQLASPTPHL